MMLTDGFVREQRAVLMGIGARPRLHHEVLRRGAFGSVGEAEPVNVTWIRGYR